MFDIGVNLTSSQFAKDSDEVVVRARAAGVKGMLLTGTSAQESLQAQRLAQRFQCWSTAGVHPPDSSSWTPAVAGAIRDLALMPGAVAIGECGPDFHRHFSTPAGPARAFPALFGGSERPRAVILTPLFRPVLVREGDCVDQR